MTESNGLEWLTVGAKVAYVHHESFQPGTVEKIGKRDVVVTVNDRTEKFNISKTSNISDRLWLYRPGGSTWARGNYLAPLDDPRIKEMAEQQRRDRATDGVRRWADEFQKDRSVETARKLHWAVDRFLEVHGDGSA